MCCSRPNSCCQACSRRRHQGSGKNFAQKKCPPR
nr:MAG TPA: hypothetical protein [Caudoviricetes sp.]